MFYRWDVQMYLCPPHFPPLFVSVCRQSCIIYLRGAFSSSRKQNKYPLSRRVRKGMSQQRGEVSCWKQGRSDTSSLLAAKEIERSGERIHRFRSAGDLFSVISLRQSENNPDRYLWRGICVEEKKKKEIFHSLSQEASLLQREK